MPLRSCRRCTEPGRCVPRWPTIRERGRHGVKQILEMHEKVGSGHELIDSDSDLVSHALCRAMLNCPVQRPVFDSILKLYGSKATCNRASNASVWRRRRNSTYMYMYGRRFCCLVGPCSPQRHGRAASHVRGLRRGLDYMYLHRRHCHKVHVCRQHQDAVRAWSPRVTSALSWTPAGMVTNRISITRPTAPTCSQRSEPCGTLSGRRHRTATVPA